MVRDFQNNLVSKFQSLKNNGSLQRDSKGNVVFQTEYGVLTCYLIAHQEQWKTMYEHKQKREPVVVHSGFGKTSSPGNKRRRRTYINMQFITTMTSNRKYAFFVKK